MPSFLKHFRRSRDNARRRSSAESATNHEPPSGRGFLRAVLWGDAVVSLALLYPALDYYQPSVQPYAVGGIIISLAIEVLCLQALRRGIRWSGIVLLLALLFGFYAVHNFVWVGMSAVDPTWFGVIYILAGAFFARAAVGMLRLWARL